MPRVHVKSQSQTGPAPRSQIVLSFLLLLLLMLWLLLLMLGFRITEFRDSGGDSSGQALGQEDSFALCGDVRYHFVSRQDRICGMANTSRPQQMQAEEN